MSCCLELGCSRVAVWYLVASHSSGNGPPMRSYSPCAVTKFCVRVTRFERFDGQLPRVLSGRTRKGRRVRAMSFGQRLGELRHAHAAMLVAQGEHPEVIQLRLGHWSPCQLGPVHATDDAPTLQRQARAISIRKSDLGSTNATTDQTHRQCHILCLAESTA
jgi:hypothetical protein